VNTDQTGMHNSQQAADRSRCPGAPAEVGRGMRGAPPLTRIKYSLWRGISLDGFNGRFQGLTEVGEQLLNPGGCCAVAFNFSPPASFLGILRQG